MIKYFTNGTLLYPLPKPYTVIAPFTSCSSQSCVIIDRMFLISMLLLVFLLGLLIKQWIFRKELREKILEDLKFFEIEEGESK
jgi:hypothetical protein